MIGEEIRNIKSGKKELRQFGFTMGAVLGVLGILLMWRGREWYPYFIITSVIFLFPACFFPLLLKPIQRAWMTLAILLGWLMTRVILIVLFYLVVTPIGLVMRLSGKDPLNRGFVKNHGSYWISREDVLDIREDYERQF